MKRNSEVFPFIIVLKNKQLPAIRGTAILSLLIAVGLFAWRSRLPEASGLNLIAAAIVAVLLGLNIYEIYRGRTTRFLPGFIISAIGLALLEPHSFFAIFYLVLAWVEKQAIAEAEIGFSEKDIVLNGLWRKQIRWSDLSNVVLKDGLLTLDFKNNTIVQKETDDLEDNEYDGEEDDFNSFCQAQLLLHNSPAK